MYVNWNTARLIKVFGVSTVFAHLHPAKITETRIFDALQQALLARRNSIFNAAIDELIARFAQGGAIKPTRSSTGKLRSSAATSEATFSMADMLLAKSNASERLRLY